ncbi:hypothetical protein EAO73_28210 [Streptomyces sp. col6]|nr:hypothetical protein EAO73_28210 [Streptomyces sp. col6]
MGDEVADIIGREWRFDGPWDWTAFDGELAGAGPAWPLGPVVKLPSAVRRLALPQALGFA